MGSGLQAVPGASPQNTKGSRFLIVFSFFNIVDVPFSYDFDYLIPPPHLVAFLLFKSRLSLCLPLSLSHSGKAACLFFYF